MSKLHISDDLSLPLDFVTQTQAILAKRGVGKSYTASVEAEELLKAGQQVVVIDPTGAWFGLKSSADGKHVGFPIAVFGGEHADVPLEEGAGEVVAQAIVERRFSAIIDLSFLRKNQRNRFMTAFLETLFRLNRVAMHLFVDEAHTIAPQKPFGEEARMLGAIEDVVMLGRRRGLGCTLDHPAAPGSQQERPHSMRDPVLPSPGPPEGHRRSGRVGERPRGSDAGERDDRIATFAPDWNSLVLGPGLGRYQTG